MTRRFLRAPVAAAAAVAMSLAVPGAAFADSQAYANTTEDGARTVKTAFELVEREGGPVDQKNEAVAYASCEACQAYAIAFSIVLVGDATSVTPVNWAQAINHECTSCTTGAWAKQWVRVGHGEPELTDLGEQRLKDVKDAVKALKKDDSLTREQIDAEVARLKAIVDDVLATQLSWDTDDDDDDADDD